MKIKPKPRRQLPRPSPCKGVDPIHNATEWAEEYEETARYVKQLCQFLMNGGSITEPTLGTFTEVRAGLTWSAEDAAAIRNKKLTQEHEAKMKKWRLAEKLKEKQRCASQEQRLAQRDAERSERKKWEGEMKSYRGHWSNQAISDDDPRLLLFRRDLSEPTTGIYIRVQGHRVDAGTFKDADLDYHIDDACFNKFWARKFRNGDAAVKFVMWRAMGVKWEQKVTKESC